jgi:hypothetical protein
LTQRPSAVSFAKLALKEESGLADRTEIDVGDVELTLFSVLDDKRDATLKAVEAMNEASDGDLFMLKAKTLGATTVSGTSCRVTGAIVIALPPVEADYNCGDSDS